jgi:hypothetical protein
VRQPGSSDCARLRSTSVTASSSGGRALERSLISTASGVRPISTGCGRRHRVPRWRQRHRRRLRDPLGRDRRPTGRGAATEQFTWAGAPLPTKRCS